MFNDMETPRSIKKTVKHDGVTLSLNFKGPAREFRELLCRLLGCNHKPRVHFDWTIGPVQNKVQQPHDTMKVQITNEQKVRVTLAPVTQSGKPAKLDGAPTWRVESGNSTVVASEDGLTADLISADEPGDTVAIVEADADIGEGVETISDVIQLTVTGANAKNLGLSAGTPELKD